MSKKNKNEDVYDSISRINKILKETKQYFLSYKTESDLFYSIVEFRELILKLVVINDVETTTLFRAKLLEYIEKTLIHVFTNAEVMPNGELVSLTINLNDSKLALGDFDRIISEIGGVKYVKEDAISVNMKVSIMGKEVEKEDVSFYVMKKKHDASFITINELNIIQGIYL